MTPADTRQELVSLVEFHSREARRPRASGLEHQHAADWAAEQIQRLDTPEFPNLFSECNPTETPTAPTTASSGS